MLTYPGKSPLILELVCVVAKEFSPMDLLEKLPETIIVLTVLVLQRGLEPRPLGRAPPESCPSSTRVFPWPCGATTLE